MPVVVPPLFRARSSDEYPPVPWRTVDRDVIVRSATTARDAASRLGMSEPAYTLDRRGTAATLRAIDDVHGGGFFAVPEVATLELDAADEAFRGDAPVVDVQTHLVDPTRWVGPGAARARRVLAHGRSRTLVGQDRPAADRRRGVGRARVRRVGNRGSRW